MLIGVPVIYMCCRERIVIFLRACTFAFVAGVEFKSSQLEGSEGKMAEMRLYWKAAGSLRDEYCSVLLYQHAAVADASVAMACCCPGSRCMRRMIGRLGEESGGGGEWRKQWISRMMWMRCSW